MPIAIAAIQSCRVAPHSLPRRISAVASVAAPKRSPTKKKGPEPASSAIRVTRKVPPQTNATAQSARSGHRDRMSGAVEGARRLVEQLEFALTDAEPGAAQCQPAGRLCLRHEGEGAQVGKTDLHRLTLQHTMGFVAMAVLGHDRISRRIEHVDPVGNEAA